MKLIVHQNLPCGRVALFSVARIRGRLRRVGSVAIYRPSASKVVA